MTKGTFRGTRRRAIKVVGFRARMRTVNGSKVIKSRRSKGRHVLTKVRYSK
uniref:Large ribosomal subunit protein bL34c n=1 Tax=Aureoumbra lagunensis TaxID=44058 RepID=C6KJ03_9STRA|nr:50S ribosomal protein L34 [Aureoumbra lagunensis]ACS36959.1 50S ribosomal protein L34 [Aureoumbra lagunensis]